MNRSAELAGIVADAADAAERHHAAYIEAFETAREAAAFLRGHVIAEQLEAALWGHTAELIPNTEEPMPNLPALFGGDPVAAARHKVEQLREAERDLSFRWSVKVGEVLAVEDTIGDLYLDAYLTGEAEPTESVTAAIKGDRELDAITRAIEAARERREAAIVEFYAAEAGQLRKEAEAKVGEVVKRKKKRADLLAALETYEGCQYVPFRPNRPMVPGDGTVVVPVTIPLTDYLANEAAGLESQAVTALARRVRKSGAVTSIPASKLDETLDGLDPMMIGPTFTEVWEWRRTAEAPFTAHLAKHRDPTFSPHHGAEVLFTVAWRDGKLDKANSRVFLGRNREWADVVDEVEVRGVLA